MTFEGYNPIGSRAGSPRAPLTPRTRSARIALSLAVVALVLSAAALAGSVLGAAAASSRGPQHLRRVYLRSWLTNAGPTLNKNDVLLVAEEELDPEDLATLRSETEDRVELAVADMELEEESRARVVEALVDRLVASEAEPLSAEELRALRERWQEVGGVDAEDGEEGERASMADDYTVGVGG